VQRRNIDSHTLGNPAGPQAFESYRCNDVVGGLQQSQTPFAVIILRMKHR
jgi:hypothetical protein